MNRNCQNCKQSFEITSDDLSFYDKIKVPPPTFCGQCVISHLMIWRNERALYVRPDSFSGENIISMFSGDGPYQVYSPKKWWSDDWDPLQYGREYDFNKSFFEQYNELLKTVPLCALFNKNAVDSDYCNHCDDSSKCYLLFGSIWNEEVSYSRGAVHCQRSFDLLHGEKLELCYDVTDGEESYGVNSSSHVISCHNSSFLIDCRNCSDCVGCVGLRNKQYCILNQQYSKEEYQKKLEELNLENHTKRKEFEKEFKKFALQFPRRFAYLSSTQNVVGDNVSHTKNCNRCFDIYQDVEDCKNIIHGGAGLKDTHDSYGMGAGELMYNVTDTGIKTSRVAFAIVGREARDAYYIYNCHNVSNVFGCVSLRNKQYCILNKQYSKEEYEELLPKVIQHMNDMPYTDSKGRAYKFGDFFPPETSPFAYNETNAQEYFPLTKKEANQKGYSWKDSEKKGHSATIESKDLPENTKDVSGDILKETIGCEHQGNCQDQCTVAFKLIPQELEFYRQRNIPLPRLCSNCRHYERLKQRNPIQLWERQCSCDYEVYENETKHQHHPEGRCPNKFQTSYAPDRPEIVYCESCYQSEVA